MAGKLEAELEVQKRRSVEQMEVARRKAWHEMNDVHKLEERAKTCRYICCDIMYYTLLYMYIYIYMYLFVYMQM